MSYKGKVMEPVADEVANRLSADGTGRCVHAAASAQLKAHAYDPAFPSAGFACQLHVDILAGSPRRARATS